MLATANQGRLTERLPSWSTARHRYIRWPAILTYAGRSGTGIGHAELERVWRRLQPLATPRMPLDTPPARDSRFGSPLTLSRVHWVRPELVAVGLRPERLVTVSRSREA
jgi:hypothetical protein